MDKKLIASMIDHTALKPDTTQKEIENLCSEAVKFSFASVCVNPCHVSMASKLLAGTGVKVCTVIGFPLGANTSDVKAFEAAKAVEDGALEVDMVINIGALKDKKYDVVLNDIKRVVDSVKHKALVKVIIETCLLTDDEKVKVCEIAKEAGADFVKTSTGFSKAGATEEDVKLMKRTVGESMKVKASGGIRTYEDAVKMINAGASRIGASASVKIVQ